MKRLALLIFALWGSLICSQACRASHPGHASPAAHGTAPCEPLVVISPECSTAKQFGALVCQGCGPELCFILMKGCVRPEFCVAAEAAVATRINPCPYLSIEDLHRVDGCQRLGAESDLPKKAVACELWERSKR